MNRKILLIPLVFIISAYFVLGAEFYVSKTDVKSDIFLSEVAEFNVTINNFYDSSDVFTISTQDPNWILLTSQVEVAANSQKTFTLRIDPGASIPLGVHALNVKIKSQRTGDYLQELFIINIRPYDPIFGEYRPSIQFDATADKEIDPRNKIPIKVYMRNRNALDVGEVKLVFNGELFQGVKTTSLGPLEEKRTEYLFEIDPLQEPGLYTLDVQLQVKNVTLNQATQSYEVIGYSAISMGSSIKSFLFRTDDTIVLENTGNSPKIKKVNLEMPWTKRLFTSSDPESVTARKDGKTSLQWEVEIPAQGYVEINVTTNYRIPIVIILAIIVIIILYFVLRSPLIVTKEAIITGAKKSEEGVEFIKIRLFVKNRSGKPIERVNVFDRVPGIAELINKKVLGTIQPEKITKQEKKGTMVKWNLETLEPFEERIITYEIKSKLKIIGNISLPSTKVTFHYKKKEHKILSQRIIVTN